MYNSPICPNSNQTIISFLFWYFVVICFRTFAFSNTVNMNLCGLPSLQSVKGCVTLVNKNILFYEIEQRYRVYPQIIGSQPVKLPAKGSTLIIDNTEGLIFRDDTIITCSETSIEPSAAFSVIVDENDIYLKALRSKSLGAKDFIVLDKVYRIMKSRFQIDDLIAAKGLISVLKSSIELPASEASATQMLVPNVLKTPVDLNYINESSNLYKGFMDQYLFCPYHSLVNGSVVEVLMGVLSVSEEHGMVVLKDGQVNIPVAFHDDMFLPKFYNQLVHIKKWTVFSEIFMTEEPRNMQYLLLHFNNVTPLAKLDGDCVDNLYLSPESPISGAKTHRTVIQICKKSLPVIKTGDHLQVFLEIVVLNSSISETRQHWAFLILEGNYLKVAPFLSEHFLYKIYHDTPLRKIKTYSMPELYGMRTGRHSYSVPDGTIFQEYCEEPQYLATPILKTLIEAFYRP
ncbi:uncharacterized protein LOC132708694 isoform X2 [Cylas formicarius]|uniref:uncharacterized protein LOC132708694 isoform X2 n=1 Tax=Cylas formicarius TaxID=197179 RepID=UPI002958CF78|nr:uncharacterized protein LOC132708694 isoform X2 [Cylas formicarius]